MLAGLTNYDQNSDMALGLPSQAAIEIQNTVRDIKTKNEVVKIIEPLVEGVAQQGIHTTKL